MIIELAQGGMSSVYLAVAEGPAGFSKMSVIKELKPTLLEEEGFLEMFLDEARLSARLSHPNVVQTNEVSVEDGRAFLAMEYLDGQSLLRIRSRLGRAGTLPLGPHVRILADACSGLHYAHELRDLDGVALSVVHRDVSPHNVFITYDGQVKLVDFGVAKAMSQSHETHVGVVKGKLPYMAPEQARGEVVDRRADVFAVGVLLWEAVANKRMWSGHRTEAILARLIDNDVPSLATLVPDADPVLTEIVARATTPRAVDRYASAELLRRDLEEWLAQRRDGDYQSLRELGDEMTRAFAAERQTISTAIHKQLGLLREASATGRAASVELVRLAEASSGSHPAISQSQPSFSDPLLPRATGPISTRESNASSAGTRGGGSMVVPTSATVNVAVRRPRRGIVIATTASLVAIGGIATGIFLSRRESVTVPHGDVGARPESAETNAPLPPTGLPDALPDSVRVQLRATPPTARLFLDGAPLATNPHAASFRKDAVMHQVRVEAPGYATKTELVSFDHEIDLAIALDRVFVPAPRGKPGAARPESTEKGDSTTPKPGRNQRPIDTDLEPR